MTTQLPTFVNRDPDVIMSEIKSKMEELLGREIQPGQIEQLILQIIGYREVLLLERFNTGMAQMLYQFSTAPILDYIAALVAVERLPAASAGVMLKFIIEGNLDTVIIYGGTRVSTIDQVIFETTEDVFVKPSVNEVNIFAVAQQAGKAANSCPANSITQILDPYAFVLSVTNPYPPDGGSDDETDEQLRERIKLAPFQYTTAGSRQSYIFHAKSANPAIIDVSVFSYVSDNVHTLPIGRLVAKSDGVSNLIEEINIVPGMVCIVPLADNIEDYTQIIREIYETCSAETVRPLCDTVIVAEPHIIEYQIAVEITAFLGADLTQLETDIKNALQAYADSKERRLGLDIVRSQIVQVARLPQVYDVKVVSPSWDDGNIIVDFDEVPICTDVSVTIIGTNYG